MEGMGGGGEGELGGDETGIGREVGVLEYKIAFQENNKRVEKKYKTPISFPPSTPPSLKILYPPTPTLLGTGTQCQANAYLNSLSRLKHAMSVATTTSIHSSPPSRSMAKTPLLRNQVAPNQNLALTSGPTGKEDPGGGEACRWISVPEMKCHSCRRLWYVKACERLNKYPPMCRETRGCGCGDLGGEGGKEIVMLR